MKSIAPEKPKMAGLVQKFNIIVQPIETIILSGLDWKKHNTETTVLERTEGAPNQPGVRLLVDSLVTWKIPKTSHEAVYMSAKAVYHQILFQLL